MKTPVSKMKEVKIESISPYKNNAKKHPEAQIQQIMESMKTFGFLTPLLIDGKNNLICGHGRLEAAKKLGLASVPCVIAEHLSDAERRAFVHVENRLQESGGAEWDKEMLKLEIEDLSLNMDFDLSPLGFSPDEISGLLNDGWNDANFSVPDKEPKAKEKEPNQITCPYCNKQFEE
jgi:ParB-like chromosome segregation protein Spo0J